MSKSSLCVAMGTRATLTKGEQKSERHRKTQAEEEKKRKLLEKEGEVGEDPRDKGRKERARSAVLIHLFMLFYFY